MDQSDSTAVADPAQGAPNIDALSTEDSRPVPTTAEMSFPGCRSFRMTAEQHLIHDRRLEFWDAENETAWELRDGPSAEHETPIQTLAQLVTYIGAVRGAPIKCFGATGVLPLDKPLTRVAHPDQIVYLDPYRAPGDPHGLYVGGYDAPDVIMEVDHTTDVQRNKLRLYEAWGVRELWVEVPDKPSPSRPTNLQPGFTIRVLTKGIYQPAAESRTFPGWRAVDIHRALNEIVPSSATIALLEKLGRSMGERQGTGPDDNPLLRSLRNESRAEGRQAGRAEGREEGRLEKQVALMRQLLQTRGIVLSPEFPANVPGFASVSDEVLATAALESADEEEFIRRLG